MKVQIGQIVEALDKRKWPTVCMVVETDGDSARVQPLWGGAILAVASSDLRYHDQENCIECQKEKK